MLVTFFGGELIYRYTMNLPVLVVVNVVLWRCMVVVVCCVGRTSNIIQDIFGALRHTGTDTDRPSIYRVNLAVDTRDTQAIAPVLNRTTLRQMTKTHTPMHPHRQHATSFGNHQQSTYALHIFANRSFQYKNIRSLAWIVVYNRHPTAEQFSTERRVNSV